MAKRYGDLADALDEMATHFRARDAGRTARDYEIAASGLRTVDSIPMDPSELACISDEVRGAVAEWRAYGEIKKLNQFREERPHVSNLTEIAKIGPKRAQKIHDETGATTIEDVRQVDADDGLEDISGIGPKTGTTIRRSIAQLLSS